MNKLVLFIFPLVLFSCRKDHAPPPATNSPATSTPVPAFGNAIAVTINGCTTDAMEPFISPDGNTLFYNSVNDGITTSLYYATKVNDSTFTYAGPVNGANQVSTPRLDAVASMDRNNKFYWVTTRNYPTQFENLLHGDYNSGNVTNLKRTYGDFNIYTPGWLIMDATINYDGDRLYFVNAYFNNCGSAPCISKLGIAQFVNDSTFARLSDSDNLLAHVNDTAYDVYAPAITKDGLELYFTRLLHNTFQTEICVSVRNTVNDPFGTPTLLYTNAATAPEAPTLTTDKSKMYYHEKISGTYMIRMRRRTN